MILVSVGSVLLTILKVIGIILLCVLGLVLLVVLLVLFCPISYRLSAVHNEQETVANVKVGFLIIKALANFTKGEGLNYSVKALFFKIFPRGSSKEEDDGLDLLEDYLEEHDDDDITIDITNESEDSDEDLGYLNLILKVKNLTNHKKMNRWKMIISQWINSLKKRILFQKVLKRKLMG